MDVSTVYGISSATSLKISRAWESSVTQGLPLMAEGALYPASDAKCFGQPFVLRMSRSLFLQAVSIYFPSMLSRASARFCRRNALGALGGARPVSTLEKLVSPDSAGMTW